MRQLLRAVAEEARLRVGWVAGLAAAVAVDGVRGTADAAPAVGVVVVAAKAVEAGAAVGLEVVKVAGNGRPVAAVAVLVSEDRMAEAVADVGTAVLAAGAVTSESECAGI